MKVILALLLGVAVSTSAEETKSGRRLLQWGYNPLPPGGNGYNPQYPQYPQYQQPGFGQPQQPGFGSQSNNPYCNPYSQMYDAQDCIDYAWMFQQPATPQVPPQPQVNPPQIPQVPPPQAPPVTPQQPANPVPPSGPAPVDPLTPPGPPVPPSGPANPNPGLPPLPPASGPVNPTPGLPYGGAPVTPGLPPLGGAPGTYPLPPGGLPMFTPPQAELNCGSPGMGMNPCANRRPGTVAGPMPVGNIMNNFKMYCDTAGACANSEFDITVRANPQNPQGVRQINQLLFSEPGSGQGATVNIKNEQMNGNNIEVSNLECGHLGCNGLTINAWGATVNDVNCADPADCVGCKINFYRPGCYNTANPFMCLIEMKPCFGY